MSSLHDQLHEARQEQDLLNTKYAQHFKLGKWFSISEVIAGLVSFCLVVLICFLIAKTDFINEGLLLLLFFYGGLFLFYCLKEVLWVLFKFLIRKYLGIDKSQSNAFQFQQANLSNRVYTIEKKIREETKNAHYSQESKFISKLNNFANVITKKTLDYNVAIDLIKDLEKEHEVIKNNGYQIHTIVYYNNRFNRIYEEINHYTNPPQQAIQIEVSKPQTKPDVTIPNNSVPVESKSSASDNQIDLVQTPTEPKPYIALKKEEEKNKTVEIAKSPEEKRIPITEIKKTSEITNPNDPTINAKREKPIPKEEEKTSSQLFGTSHAEVVTRDSITTYQPKLPVKIDFSKLNEHKHNIGALGELYVFEKEQNRLINQGMIEQSKQIVHVSLKTDSEGYDIASFTDSGERKYIEVKTTTGNEFEPFYLSNSEMEAMKRLNNYWIYRVYNFNTDLKKGDVFKIDCGRDLDTHYNIKASNFKVSPKSP